MHHLVLGSTGYGKSSLAGDWIRESQRTGRAALVLDPFLATDWPGLGGPLLEVRRDPAAYLRLVESSRRCLVVMDESGDESCRPIVDEIVRKARHWGHLCLTLVHRATMVSPTVRYCSLGGLWLFRLLPPEVEMVERQYGQLAELGRTLELEPHRCLHYAPPYLGRPPLLHATSRLGGA